MQCYAILCNTAYVDGVHNIVYNVSIHSYTMLYAAYLRQSLDTHFS